MILDPYRFAPAGGTDPYFANVSLLLNPAGANGTFGYVDLSSYAHTLSRLGSSVFATDFVQFTSSSIDPSAVTSGVLAPDHAAFDFGSGHYTIEMWIRQTTNFTTGGLITKRADNAVYAPFALYVQSPGGDGHTLRYLSSANGSTWAVNIAGATTMVINTWYHVCVDYDGTTVRGYVDGVVDASQVISQTVMTNTSQVALPTLAVADASFEYVGRIGPLRVTKGVARYAGAFSRPTAAFPTS